MVTTIRIEFRLASGYHSHMRCSWVRLQCIIWLAATLSGQAATGRVIKVLPMFLDLQGHHTVSPSLYDRDAYQAHLRLHPEKRSGMMFATQWKTKGESSGPLTLRLELRGIVKGGVPREMTIEKTLSARGHFSHWTNLVLSGEDYQAFGEVTAWRVTLWEGGERLGAQQSFLW